MRALKVVLVALAIIALAALLASSASAKKRAATVGAANSAVAECVKQHGGSYDPVTKRWSIYTLHEGYETAREDALRDCLARRLGVSRAQVPIGHRYIDRPEP